MTKMITELYVDGGVIGTNPSMIGGTFAYYLIHDDGRETGAAQVITDMDMGSPVTNNQTEMLALIAGLEQLPADFKGTIYSDSKVTLGRVFMGWKWKNIPAWMHKRYQKQRAKFTNWDEIKYVLLDGHPTKAQLKAGIGKRGSPVSKHNVWCDEACRQAGEAFMENVGRNIPTAVEEGAYA
jgi:ribonuclease HI